MKLEMFIDKLNMAKDKEQYFKDAITTKYIPYQEKIAICENIVNVSMNEKQNTPLRYMLFTLSLIDKYTNIDIDFDHPLSDFNMLLESGVGNQIVVRIPDSERDIFQTILDMCMDDYVENNKSLTAFLDTKLKALELAFGAMNDGITEIMNNSDLLQK